MDRSRRKATNRPPSGSSKVEGRRSDQVAPEARVRTFELRSCTLRDREALSRCAGTIYPRRLESTPALTRTGNPFRS